MKKSIFKLGFIAAMLSLTLTSCGDDDENTTNDDDVTVTDDDATTDDVYDLIDSGELNGEIDEDVTLDATVAYSLTGIFTVAEGATLTIPAGTTITASATDNTDNYIHVDQGATINVEGEVDNPVIMTSTDDLAGEWGGLVITGYGITTAGVDATAEVGDLNYGGTEEADNSGTIENLVIIGSGAIINDDSQFNGLSLYAVGSGTTIQNIAILNGEDDGVEFFGGSVEVTNLYVEGAEDDAIDWTEGWNGGVTNAYILHDSDFSTAVEADGINENPTLTNITAVSTTGTDGVALQFKSLSGATITGLTLTGYTTQFDFPDTSTAEDVIVDEMAADETATYDSSTIDFSAVDFLNDYLNQ